MAPNASDKDKDAGDRTQIGAAPPPPVPRTPAAGDNPPPYASPDPIHPSPPAAAGDDTGRVMVPPPRAPGPEKPAVAPAPQPSPPPAADEEGTVILTRTRQATATLQRLQPPGRSETIALDRTSYLVGRSHKCDVVLYSETASREHARLTFRDAAWYVQPLGEKAVIADGVAVREEQRLTHKTRLQLGGDELLFFDERAAAAPLAAAPLVAPSNTSPHMSTHRSRIAALVPIAVAVLVAIGLAAWWWISGGVGR